MRPGDASSEPLPDPLIASAIDVCSISVVRAFREADRARAATRMQAAGAHFIAEHPEFVVFGFSSATHAISTTCAIVAIGGGYLRAGVSTGESSGDWSDLRKVAEVVANAAEAGQVVVCLSSLELARGGLSASYTFHDLGSAPLPEDASRVRLFLVDHESLKSVVSGARTPIRREAVFIGRQRELSDLKRSMDLSRLVTVVGSTGVGKSALVRRFALDVEEDFHDGVWSVDLSEVENEHLVIPQICSALEVVKTTEDTYLDALAGWLSTRSALLILDGYERWLSVIRDVVARLLLDCHDLQILCSGQRPLRLECETVYRLKGLESAPEGLDWTLAQECDAVALFMDRAQQADHSFRANSTNASWIARICRQLDGLPFAIDLAASKVTTLTPRQIHDRLTDRLSLLRDAKGTRPRRHTGLRAALDASTSLLTANGRRLLARISIMRGAFDVGVASAIACDDALTPDQVVDAFEELVDCSLLTASEVLGDERFFYLSETVRLYAADLFADRAEKNATVERKLRWLDEFSANLSSQGAGAVSGAWRARSEAAYEDARDGIQIYLARNEVEQAARLAVACAVFWYLQGYGFEGRTVLTALLNHHRVAEIADYPRCLNLMSVIQLSCGDLESAMFYARSSVREARKAGNTLQKAASMSSVAMVAFARGNVKRANALYRVIAPVFRIANDPRLLGTLKNLVATCTGPISLEEEVIWREVEDLLQKSGLVASEADFQNTCAHRLLDNGRKTDAVLAAKRAMRRAIADGNLLPQIRTARTMVAIEYACEHPKHAVWWYFFAQRLREEANDPVNRWNSQAETIIQEITGIYGIEDVDRWAIESRQMSQQEYEDLLNST